ncbi:MAG: arylamine N-acetyltransferase [Vicinamibacterales bacterium]|nr:arylamine N-acetyltransferase [Vicinamibacterales bacterium]
MGYDAVRAQTLAALAALQRAFLLSVPFENLDIHLGRPITVAGDHAYGKIVGDRRGGFCYECNGLFADMLTAIGFTVTMLSARMVAGDRVGEPFDHMVLRVELDQPYLVDVGNGESCREPLTLDGATESRAEGRTYRVGAHADELALWFREADGEWAPRFLFDLVPRRREEFAERCHHHQTSPASHFTQKRLITLATAGGRVTLMDRQLTVHDGDRRDSRELASDAEWLRCLRDCFGIEL